jgi:hypothetical protein
MSQDELLDELGERPNLHPLFRRVLNAVRDTESERKLRILRQILGEAVVNRARRVDIDMIFVATIDDLEAAHSRVHASPHLLASSSFWRTRLDVSTPAPMVSV